ncbi:hypothetical protein J132_07725 [Termitomyces sp. J132]|nr:hypothetical protein J132_07725 [Termitomyces sp. J132]
MVNKNFIMEDQEFVLVNRDPNDCRNRKDTAGNPGFDFVIVVTGLDVAHVVVERIQETTITRRYSSAFSMQSFHQAMDALTLKDTPKPTLPLDNPAIPDKMFLPLPKRTSGNKGHHMYYGFPVSEDWVSAYCDLNSHRIENYGPDFNIMDKIDIVLQLLRVSSTIKNLDYASVFPEGADVLNLEAHRGRRCDCILTVCNTRPRSYRNRPTQSQFNELQSIMGAEAGWYIDLYPIAGGK